MLILPNDIRDKIIKQCIRECPNEACGILAGKAGIVEKVYEMANAEPSPENFFMEASKFKKFRLIFVGMIFLGVLVFFYGSGIFCGLNNISSVD